MKMIAARARTSAGVVRVVLVEWVVMGVIPVFPVVLLTVVLVVVVWAVMGVVPVFPVVLLTVVLVVVV